MLQWWAGDGIAVLVVGGPVLLWSQRRALVASRWAELALVVLLTAALSVVAFRFGDPPFVLILPILAWAAFRLGDLGVVLAGTAFAAVANYMTAAGYGEFAHLGLSSAASVALTQAYIAIIVLLGWVLAQEVTGRMSAVQDRDLARVQHAVADARRMAAELGALLADAATVSSVGEQVSAAVREYLQGIAEAASRALERARLREAERRGRARVEALSEITRLLAAALTLDAIGDVVIDRVRAAVGGADALSLGVISQDRQRLEWVTAVGVLDEIRQRFPDPALTVPAAATEAARTGRPVLIRTPGEYELRYPGPHTSAIVAQASSWLAWPLRVGATTVGSIGIAWKNLQ